jgi:hypothetical protein
MFLPEWFHLSFCAFCLAPSLWEASFLPEHYCLRFCDFNLAPSLWGASFLSERSYLRFRNFNLAPSLWGASFLLECSHVRFRDFNLAPSLWGALFLPERSRLLFRDFNLAPILWGAPFLKCYFVEPVGYRWARFAHDFKWFGLQPIESSSNLVWYFDVHGHWIFFGNQNLYLCFGLQELLLVKNLTPLRISTVRKRVRARLMKM